MIKLNPDFIMREIAGEYILVPTGASAEKYNGLITINEVGSFIFNNIEKTKSLSELVKLICDEYEVDEATAAKDTIPFVNYMFQLGIITEEQ